MATAAPTTCAVCSKRIVEKYSPFCSARCADIDLGSWLNEKYRVPTNEQPASHFEEE
jgi:uncharacterized protein